MFKDFSISDIIKTKTKDKNKATTKTKTETKNKDMVDKINDKINMINKLYNRLEKAKANVIKRIELICKGIRELEDEIYSDDSWFRLVELEKIDAIIDEALNVVWNMICRENRIGPEEIKIDEHKDIDGYVSKLRDVINNKIKLVNTINREIYNIMSEIDNEAVMVDEKIRNASEMDNDTVHLINDKLMEIVKKSMKNLKKIVVQLIWCINKVTIQV